MVSYGNRRRIVKEWEISAVLDAILEAKQDLSGTTIFTNYFPSAEDAKIIVASGIASLNYMGKIEDMEAIRFLNSLPNSLEVIRLE